jgi:nitrite reductase/ring-hydroxylating ferredoxin subunit
MDEDAPGGNRAGDGEDASGDCPEEVIAPLASVPADSTHLFTVRDVHADTEVEAILVRTDGSGDGGDGSGSDDGDDSSGGESEREGNEAARNADGGAADAADADTGAPHVRAWLNYCQHWTDVRLDGGSGATRRDGDIVCGRHGATFEADSGHCDFGPCEGAYLDGVGVAVSDGTVRLTDPDYEFCHEGPIEDDEDLDLSTNPGDRLGF